ncbi:hypothetical protein H633G_11536 [Metarhizium anisopliae BRIP 53284]|nr:hypothetical protein H633G_11536 [Metarhizium anisopliae BRIP 53284]
MEPIDEALEYLKSADKLIILRRHDISIATRLRCDGGIKANSERDFIAYIHKLSSRGIPPTLSMIKNFAQDIAKIKVGKDWPYSFVRRNRTELGCIWFDGLDAARKRADNASRYKDYFELKIRTKIEKYNILPCKHV